MRGIALVAISAAFQLATSAAVAQSAGNATTTAPPMGMGPGGHMYGGGMHAGADSTMGSSLMTPEERRQHWARMSSMKNGTECRAYVAQHHRDMAERAKQQGVSLPAQPMHDPCAGLPD